MLKRKCFDVQPIKNRDDERTGDAWRAAQPAVPADRFAREIVRFDKLTVARSRQLNGNPLGGRSSYMPRLHNLLCHMIAFWNSCLLGDVYRANALRCVESF